MRGMHTAYARNTHGLCEERTRLMRGAHTAYTWSAHGFSEVHSRSVNRRFHVLVI